MSSKLPAIKDIYSESVDVIKENNLNILLNQPPKENWIKQHPIVKNVKYIPIERVEYLLTSIFIKWNVEVKTVQLIANSVVVTIRLHFMNPITNEMEYQDGIGASPLQTDKDAGATDWTRIKSDAVMKSAPAAESFAVKDAAEKIGNLFGKDLNRADRILYDSLAGKFDAPATDLIGLKKQYIDLIDKQDKDFSNILRNEVKKIEESGKLTIEKLQELIGKIK